MDHLGEQRQAAGGKVLRARAGHLPCRFGGIEGEFHRHEAILLAQARGVGIFIVFRRGDEAGATKKERLHDEELVGMAVEKFQRHMAREHLEGLAVEAESESSRQGDVSRSLPVARGGVDYLQHALGLAVDALHGQRGEPVGAVDGGEIGDGVAAGERAAGVEEHLVATAGSVGGAADHCLRYHRAVGAPDLHVALLHHMEYHRVVGRVGVVVVAQPVGGAHMDLDVAHPGLAVDFDGSVEEVGPGVGVEFALVHDGEPPSVHGGHAGPDGQAVVPNELHQSFHCRGGGGEGGDRPAPHTSKLQLLF